MSDSSYSERDGNRTSNIVFAIDAVHDRNCSAIAIIADITKDDAWITADVSDIAQLDAWR